MSRVAIVGHAAVGGLEAERAVVLQQKWDVSRIAIGRHAVGLQVDCKYGRGEGGSIVLT